MEAGEIALLALGLPRILSGDARWTEDVARRARGLPFRWRRSIRAVLMGDAVDAPELPGARPRSIPLAPPVVPGAPPELVSAITEALAAISTLDDAHASDSPLGPLRRDTSPAELVRSDLLWRTVAAPDTILADASRGGLSIAQVDALGTAYPGLLDLWVRLLDAEIARHTRAGAPSPAVRRFVALLHGEPPPTPPARAAPAPPAQPRRPSASQSSDLAAREETGAQEIESTR